MLFYKISTNIDIPEVGEECEFTELPFFLSDQLVPTSGNNKYVKHTFMFGFNMF